MVFLIGVAAGFERPALTAFEAQVIPIEHATRGASWTGSMWTGGAIVGPAVAGLAIAFLGIPATYLVLAVLMAVAVGLVTRISRKPMPQPDAREGTLESLASGVRYVVRHQVLLASMALDLFAVFFGGAIALLPVFASDILGVGPIGLGLLRTAPSVGALLAMLATAGRACVVTHAAQPASATALLSIPEVRALLGARGLAALGMSAIATVVAFQVWELTGEPLALGILGLVEAIPALGLMLFGGHVADRRDRRSVILVTGVLLALGTLALAIMSLQPESIGLGGILAVVFLIGVAAGFERPALTAFETQVIPIEQATQGASWTGSMWTGGAIVGPALAGVAIAFLGIPATYLLLAVLMAVAVLLVTRISRKPMPQPEEGEGVIESLTSGVRYVVRHQVLLASMALDLFAVFFGGAIALLPVFASDILGVGPIGLGLLRTAPSVGALLAMLATARFPPKRRAGPILLVCVAIFGLSMLVFGLSTTFVLSMGALFVAGLADGVSVVIRIVIVRVESPEAMRGRIASVNHVFISASNELGAFESGVAATLLGVVPSVIAGGLVTLGIVAVVAVLAPQLRRLDLGRRMIEGPGAQPMALAVEEVSLVSGAGPVPEPAPGATHR